jgi:hypothetical protein
MNGSSVSVNETDPFALPGVNSVNASLIASNVSIWNVLTSFSTSNTSIWTNINGLYANLTSFVGTSYYANITDLQTSNTTTNNRITSINGTVNNLLTSNTSIWDALGLVSLNFTSFTTSNTSIWNYINNNYVNVSNLQSSNSSVYTRTNTLNTTIAYINGTLIPALYTNVTNLQASNTSTNLRITQLNTSLLNSSMGAFYSKTVATYTGSLSSGSLVGYQAGNAICNISFAGTHFCTQEEVLETMWRTNVSTIATWTGTAWVSSGAPKYAPASTPVNDCNGWTSSVASSYLGNYWAFSTSGGGVGATIKCGTSVALAFCGVG